MGHMSLGVHNHLDLLARYERGLMLKEAIFRAVQPGDVVLDAGCGTGILSLWAAQAGASRVYAVDHGDVSLAQRLAAENGVDDRITCLRGDLSEVASELEACDVLLGMVYFNDPRRDEQQELLTAQLRARVLRNGGRQVPDRVTYTATAADWPTQDLSTRRSDQQARVTNMEQRYGVSLGALLESATFDPRWFPRRDQTSGALFRTDARLLSEPVHFHTTEYAQGVEPLPEYLLIPIVRAGTLNTVIFTQNLYVGDRLIYSNESVSWLAQPVTAEPGRRVPLALGPKWRSDNILVPAEHALTVSRSRVALVPEQPIPVPIPLTALAGNAPRT